MAVGLVFFEKKYCVTFTRAQGRPYLLPGKVICPWHRKADFKKPEIHTQENQRLLKARHTFFPKTFLGLGVLFQNLRARRGGGEVILKETHGLRGLLEKVEVFFWKNEHFVFLHGAGNRLNGGAAAKVSEKPWLGSRNRVWPKNGIFEKV